MPATALGAYQTLSKVYRAMGAGFVLALILVVLASIVLREMFGLPLVWANEVAICFFVWGVFLGAGVLSLDMALAMILASAALLVITGSVPLHLIAAKAVAQISLFPLLAIPGFVVAGELMNITGLTPALGELARVLVGRWRGGM